MKLQPREGMWQTTRLLEIDLGVLKYGRMQLKDLPKFDGVILCYDSLVPASYEALPNLMGGCFSAYVYVIAPSPHLLCSILLLIHFHSLSSRVSSSRHAVDRGWLSCRLTPPSISGSRGGRLLALRSRTRVDDDDDGGWREENAGRVQLDCQGSPPTA